MRLTNNALSAWHRMQGWPAGKWLFSRVVCWKAPFSASVRPRFRELRHGLCRVHLRKRHAVLNHIGTIHAIAICNAAEIAAGTMMTVTVPATHRWIPKGMTVEYLHKAETDLEVIAALDPLPAFADAAELLVTCKALDTTGQEVLRAVISMWITPRQGY